VTDFGDFHILLSDSAVIYSKVRSVLRNLN